MSNAFVLRCEYIQKQAGSESKKSAYDEKNQNAQLKADKNV